MALLLDAVDVRPSDAETCGKKDIVESVAGEWRRR